MNDINFDAFLRIFDYLTIESDLFRWSRSCKTIHNFFKEEPVCKKIVELYYGLDVGSKNTPSYYHLLRIASRTTNYFQACQYGFHKIIGKFKSLPPATQMYCIEVATANHQYYTVKFCVDGGFTPNWYHQYDKNNNLLLIALSCDCQDIMNLFFEHGFFPNDDLWLKAPDYLFEKVYENLKELDNIRFLVDPQLRSRFDRLMAKVNHRKISLKDEYNSKLSNDILVQYLKFIPHDFDILERTLYDIVGRNLFSQWVDLLSVTMTFLKTDKAKREFLTYLFICGQHQEMIYLLQLPDFIVDIEFLQRIYSCHIDYLDKFDHSHVHHFILEKYRISGKRGENIIHHLTLKKHNYNNLRFLKYWVQHHSTLQNYLATHQTYIIGNDPIFDHFTGVLKTLKTTDDCYSLLKYLQMFENYTHTSFDICKTAFDKYAKIAMQYELFCTLFAIAAKQPEFAIRLFPNLELFSDEQFMWKITIQNFKVRFSAWMNVKKFSVSQLWERCFSRPIKMYAILYICHSLQKELSDTTIENVLINQWKCDQKSINMTSLRKMDDKTIDKFLQLVPLLLNPTIH
jgi:hypothetical protein